MFLFICIFIISGDTILPNIGFLFKGYNVIQGNPLDPSGSDPGFKASIFKAEFNTDRRTADQNYKIPDFTDVITKRSCSMSASVNTIMTQSEYQQDLSLKASASVSGQVEVVEASFTASAEYTRISKELKSNAKTIIKNEATCLVYEARILTGTRPSVTEDFLASVRELAHDDAYERFLNTYGTHFVDVVNMGAR